MLKILFRKKSIDELTAEISESEGTSGLKKSLTAWQLIFLGIGAIIGAGLFVRTAAAAANNAGPSVTIGFVVAGFGCLFAGLCYAEFASMIPRAGSAYTYSYATMGELTAWIIGWDLVLEYALGAATVSIAWSEYLNKLLGYFQLRIPYAWSHSPFEILKDTGGQVIGHGIMNIPALFIIIVITLLLIKGVRESSLANAIIVITKVTIVILFIIIGWHFINPVNFKDYIPANAPTPYLDSQGLPHHFGGFLGILGAAATVFFAFIGFDAVSTAAQESKNPKKDMPIGILGSLVICTILYVLFAYVLTGVGTIEDFRNAGREASVAFVIQKYMHGYAWLAIFVTIAILAGFSSVILVMLFGQSRVFYSMSHDGLLPRLFSDIHSKFRTPHKSNLTFLVFVGLFASFIPGDVVGDMTSIGTLFAFTLVCIGVWILRVTNPEMHREFKTPYVPYVPILGILVCGAMIYSLGWAYWLRLLVWLVIGLVIYFTYSIKHSKLKKA